MLSASKWRDSLIMEMLMETTHASFTKLIGCYFDTWYLFAQILLPSPALLHGQGGMTRQRAIPLHLHAAYRVLQLQAEVSLAEVRAQYRELAKLSHPDAGGSHADFLALQQAYEQVVAYLQTPR
jgi:DnaJ-domain-containing protein 1